MVFPREDDEGHLNYSAFSVSFVNKAAVMEARNASYPCWGAEGYLVVTPGNETDFAVIEDYVRDLAVVSMCGGSRTTPGNPRIYRNDWLPRVCRWSNTG